MSTNTEAKSTSLAELRERVPQIKSGVRAGFTDSDSFELAQRAAKALAASDLVPQNYQSNIPNCLIALEMAQRIGASPLMVAQNLYVVHGRPSWSAKFLIATWNQCGRFSPIRYKFQGTEGSDDWGCRAYATELQTGDNLVGPLVTIALAKAEGWYGRNGSKWKTIPELMLRYRAAAWFVNTCAPEISMGLTTAEEIHDVYDATLDQETGEYTVTTEELRDADNAAEVETDAAPAAEGETTSVAVQQMLDDLMSSKSPKTLAAAWKNITSHCKEEGIDVPFEVEVRHQELIDAFVGRD